MTGGDINMNAFRFPVRTGVARASLPIVFAIGALGVFGSYAQAAAEPTQEVTITGTKVERIPYDFSVRRPVNEVSVTARVPADLNVLTLNSGVALLQDSVREAALKACMTADPNSTPTSDATIDCVNAAVRNAQPQIHALVQKARSEEENG
jgi:UrcA family protein